MICSANIIVQQRGMVFRWASTDDTEMDFGWASQQVGLQHQGHGPVRLILFNYRGEWRNKLYDKANKTAVQLKVLSIEGKRCDFIYSGMRTVGLLNGDVAAARGKEPEWYKIHVRRMSVSNQRKEETIAATWERISQPA